MNVPIEKPRRGVIRPRHDTEGAATVPSKTTATYDPPVQIIDALDALIATIARGAPEEGQWYIPNGACAEVRWLNRKGVYRFTLDLMPPGTQREDQA